MKWSIVADGKPRQALVLKKMVLTGKQTEYTGGNVVSRRSWGKRLIVAAMPWLGLTTQSQPVLASQRDWLYFHYEQQPVALPEVIASLKSLPTRLSKYYRQELTVKPVHVLVFPNRQCYLRHLDRTLPKAPRRTSLFVVRGGKPTILIVDGERFQQDLVHEAVHAVNYANFGSGEFPLWLDEGVAEWFEDSESRQEKIHGELIRGIMGDQRQALAVPLKMSTLERITSTMRADAMVYAASWAWCRFLGDHSTACHRVWLRYLSDIQSGIAPGKLSHRLTLAVPNYEELFLRSLSLKTASK